MNISSNNLKYCPHCGAKNKIQANFCHKCGYKFKNIQNEYSNKPTMSNDSSNKSNGIDEKADKSLKHVAVFVGAIVLVVIICLASGMHSSSEYSGENNNNSTSSTTDNTHQEAQQEANTISNNSGKLNSILMNEYQDCHVVGNHINVDVETTDNQDNRVQDMWNEIYDNTSNANSIPVNIEAEGVVVATGTTDSGDLSFND